MKITFCTLCMVITFPVMKFQVLTATGMKMAVLWVVALCGLAEDYRRFRGACYLHHFGDDDGDRK
jgi:hypothetical protein